MNTTHRSIWNTALGTWVAVSEITRSCGKRSAGAIVLTLACSSVAAQAVSIDSGASHTAPGTYASPWNITGTLTVGDTGQGTLTVGSAATISNNNAVFGQNAGAIGNATVTGAGTTWASAFDFYVGYNGTGTLTVQNGGKVSNGNSGYVGLNAGGIGNATVTGAGSTWTNAVHFFVGYGGAGTLTVQDGGKVSNTSGYLGMNTGSVGNATVTGVGSTWNSSAAFNVGRAGAGTLTVANGGHVSINSGTGVLDVALLASSTGVLNIGAATGSAAQAAGTVAAGELRFGVGTGSLNFNHTDAAYTFGTPITGAGVLNHYAGTTLLTGANTYTGATTISGGTLRVNGSIANSNVTVSSGGILGGSGTVSNTTIASGGILAPGNSIGTLTINGGLAFNVGGIYRVEVDALGNSDRTNVIGNVFLNGTVDVQASAGTYAANTTYTILTNTGTQSNSFAGATSNLAFLTPTLSYDANNVYLNLARNNTSFSNVAATPNQRATSTALERAALGASGDLSTIMSAVTGSSNEQARAAYDAISGAGLVALRRTAPAFANNFGNQLRARLNAVGASASASATSLNGIQLAANDHINDLMPVLAQAPQQKFTLAGGIPQTPTETRGFWLRAYGSDQDTDSDGNAAGNRIKDAGISVGFDTKVSSDLLVGAALTHGSADINTDNHEDGRSRGNAVALYGSYAADAWNFNGSATLARNDNSMQRRIAFGGIDRIAQSDFDSDTVALYGEATYNLAMNGWTLQPLTGLSLSRNMSDAFTETGADALNLQVGSQTVNSVKTLFGAKAIFDFDTMQLQPRAIWSHEFGDANSAMSTQLQGIPTPFVISGVDLPRDTLIAGLTLVGNSSERLALFADVQGEFNSQQTNLGLLVGLRASW